MPKRKTFNDFWSEFEESMKNIGLIGSIPESVKDILSAVGYNSAFSFLTVTEEKLIELEAYIEKNARSLADSFVEYKPKQPFTFLPGHRSLIMGIKQELLSRQEMKKPKVIKHRNSPTLNENDLRISLINQVSTYAHALGLKENWDDSVNEIKLITTENSLLAHCSISCPVCGSISNIRYEKHWKVSNIFKHIRLHSTATTSNDKTKNSENNSNDTAHLAKRTSESTITRGDNSRINTVPANNSIIITLTSDQYEKLSLKGSTYGNLDEISEDIIDFEDTLSIYD